MIKGLLVHNGDILGIRIEKDGNIVDIGENIFATAGIDPDARIERIKLVPSADNSLLISEFELKNGITYPSVELTASLADEVIASYKATTQKVQEKPVIEPKVEPKAEPKVEKQPEPSKEVKEDKPTKQPEAKKQAPKKEQVKAKKADGKQDKKTKTNLKSYTVLLGVSKLGADKKTVTTKEVKHNIESSSLVSAKMAAREVVALEHDVPMKDVRVIKAGLAK